MFKIINKVSKPNSAVEKASISLFFSKMKGQQGENPLKVNVKDVFIAFIGVFITLFLLMVLTTHMSISWIIGPFGASSALAFASWKSPFAQPRNIIGGHEITSFVSLIVYHLFENEPWTIALAVGLAIALMMLTKTTHPPAAGDPFIIILGSYSWSFLFTPILLGTVVIVIMALIINNVQRDREYPIFWW